MSGWPHHNFAPSLFKNFGPGFGEDAKLRVRPEFFNTFKPPQFDNPGHSVTQGRFGSTLLVRDPFREARVIQFGKWFIL